MNRYVVALTLSLQLVYWCDLALANEQVSLVMDVWLSGNAGSGYDLHAKLTNESSQQILFGCYVPWGIDGEALGSARLPRKRERNSIQTCYASAWIEPTRLARNEWSGQRSNRKALTTSPSSIQRFLLRLRSRVWWSSGGAHQFPISDAAKDLVGT